MASRRNQGKGGVIQVAHRVVFEGADSARKVAVRASSKLDVGLNWLAPRKPLACFSEDPGHARHWRDQVRGCRVLFALISTKNS